MEKKLRILHLISGGDSGGAKTHVFSLLDKLKDMAYVKVGCLIEGVFYEELLEKDVDSVLFKQKNRFDLSVVKDIADMIKNERFDVFHVHGARANFVAGFVKKRADVPIVTTMHSDYLLDFDTFVKKIVFTNLNKRALKKIPYFIAVSGNFKDMLIERGFRPNAVYTVFNGMDYSRVPEKVTDKREYALSRGFSYDEKKVYIGIAARFDAVKSVDTFIKAAGEVLKRRENAEFIIAGDGAEREKLEKCAKETGFSDKIHFLGYENDIYSFLNTADINCLTSLCESFPYSMLEGAAMGKPMAASRVGGIPSLVRDYETGFLFESGNYEEMAQKLIIMIDDKALREKMGENIKRRATTLFTNENLAKTHIRIYESIIKDYRDKKRCDFIVSGYYGFNNNGDDALLKALTEDVRRKMPDARITVLSNSPEETRRLYRTDAVSRKNAFAVFNALKKSKVLLSGGGSLLQDETSSKSLWYYLAVIKAAKMCSLRVMQYANGFGPVTKPLNIRLTARVINECVDVITLRETASLKTMEKIGIKVKKSVTADPAMLLSGADGESVARLFERENIPPGDYMTLSVREWKKNAPDFEENVAAAVKSFAEDKGLNVILIPMQQPNDAPISRKIASLIGARAFLPKERLEIEDVIGIVKGAKLNCAMRLHALIYSVSKCVRTVALRYDPKVDGFMEYVGLKNIVNVENLTEKELYATLNSAFSQNPPDCERLVKKAEENTFAAIRLLENRE